MPRLRSTVLVVEHSALMMQEEIALWASFNGSLRHCQHEYPFSIQYITTELWGDGATTYQAVVFRARQTAKYVSAATGVKAPFGAVSQVLIAWRSLHCDGFDVNALDLDD